MKFTQKQFDDLKETLGKDNSGLNTKSVLNDLVIIGVLTASIGTAIVSSKIISKHKSYFPDSQI
ncbi:hypothetical protein HF875_08015 [Paraclostridium bifermentans]|uniref:Uncharacterized protein n=1 Tax=Paraclostridium bifermentans TaxID=1490 RepID=A0AA44DKT7_PARBF|nr:hypothetical protein [Paraclostridium bifermentans]NME09462.1 hypothetical protein [Paraclostridium bifermentans]